MRRYGGSTLRAITVEFWLLQCRMLGSLREDIEPLTMFVDMNEVVKKLMLRYCEDLNRWFG